MTNGPTSYRMTVTRQPLSRRHGSSGSPVRAVGASNGQAFLLYANNTSGRHFAQGTELRGTGAQATVASA